MTQKDIRYALFAHTHSHRKQQRPTDTDMSRCAHFSRLETTVYTSQYDVKHDTGYFESWHLAMSPPPQSIAVTFYSTFRYVDRIRCNAVADLRHRPPTLSPAKLNEELFPVDFCH